MTNTGISTDRGSGSRRSPKGIAAEAANRPAAGVQGHSPLDDEYWYHSLIESLYQEYCLSPRSPARRGRKGVPTGYRHEAAAARYEKEKAVTTDVTS
jgi:hypothetical protein